MEDMGKDRGEVLVVGFTETFLAGSLVTKLQSEGIPASMSRGSIKEIEEKRELVELLVLFMGENTEEMAENLVYIKDLANDRDLRIILIGEQNQYATACRTIPETLILEWFKRPLVMDDLIKCIGRYMDENTGEKRRKNILIVDDDITYMRTVYEWLKGTYHVGMSSNGVQAISYLAKNKADLVLLDYEMPIANGPQVLAMLKNDSETDSIPVMFLTGHGDKESVLSVVGLEPADYLLKTIDKETLLKKLDDFFRSRRT